MDNIKTIQHNLATIGWGALLVWWGLSFMIGPITISMSAIGTGLILLGVNAARALKGIRTSGLTTTLGILALVLGGLELAISVLHLPFELPAFAILLIVLGVILLARELLRSRNE
jgi:hypothetical protein